jgi:GH25 family lysozyme M1 (1,4-beta-N-acetylmuramidase)
MKKIIIIILVIFFTACTTNNEEIIITTREPYNYLTEIPYEFNDYQEHLKFQEYVNDNNLNISIGIDVSSHNDEINWKQVKDTGLDFAMIRLGYRGYQSGDLNLDNFYYYNMDETEHYNIDNGVYFVTQAITIDEAYKEAEYVVSKLEGYDLELPVVVDIEEVYNEDNRTEDLTIEQRTDFLIIFLESIINKDYPVLIYTNSYFLNNNLEYEKLEKYDLWIANYKDEPELPEDFFMWQYSSEGFVNGIYNNVDLNIKINK